MSTVDITIPSVGESITEATIEEWFKQSGDYVEKEDVIVSLETDKASVEITAEASGVLTTSAEEGDTLEIGAKIGSIDSSKKAEGGGGEKSKEDDTKAEASPGKNDKNNEASSNNDQTETSNSSAKGKAGPAAKHILGDKGINESDVKGTGPKGNITKADAQNAKASGKTDSDKTSDKTKSSGEKSEKKIESPSFESRESRKVKMTTLRKRIAERLVQS